MTPTAKPFTSLTEAEQVRILTCYEGGTYVDIRDQALVGCYLATGWRFPEILSLKLGDLNTISGEIRLRAKGGDEQTAVASPRALKMLKRYLKIWPNNPEQQALWLTDEGTLLTFWGGRSVFRRLKQESGIRRVHSHLFRHTFAQAALEKGAERTTLQDVLGHKTQEMTRRYAGSVRQQAAPRLMPKYAPI